MEVNEAVYYRVWGLDHVAYGPVELPALVTWIRDGRVLPDSWVFRQDQGAWSRASDQVELKGLFKEKPAAGAGAKAGPGIKPGTLRRMKIFAEMDERQLQSLLQYIEVVKLPPFAEVVHKGDHGDAMYLIVEGELRARVVVDGKETTLSTMTVGDSFGELALLDHGPRSADVIANKESTVLVISAAALDQLCKEAPALATPFLRALSRAVAIRVRALTKRYEDSIHIARSTA